MFCSFVFQRHCNNVRIACIINVVFSNDNDGVLVTLQTSKSNIKLLEAGNEADEVLLGKRSC